MSRPEGAGESSFSIGLIASALNFYRATFNVACVATEVHQKDEENSSNNVFAKLNLVDLAGSERQKGPQCGMVYVWLDILTVILHKTRGKHRKLVLHAESFTFLFHVGIS